MERLEDYVLEELPDVLRKVKSGQPCSASSILRSMNIAGPVVSDSIEQETSQADKSMDVLDDSSSLESGIIKSREDEKKVPAKATTGEELKKKGVTDNVLVLTPSLECAIKQSREEEKKVLVAKATTEELKEEGVIDSVLVLTELLKPLKNVVPWLQEIFTWERPIHTLAVLAASLIITYMWRPFCIERISLWRNYSMRMKLYRNARLLKVSAYKFWGWKSSVCPGNSAISGKKLAGRGNKQESIAYPLLSPFIYNVPIPNSNSSHQDEKSSLGIKDHINIHSAKRMNKNKG